VEPEDAIGDGPFIYIALPAGVTRIGVASGELPDLIPINATKLLREWEVLLDPIAAMPAAELLREVPNWVIGEVFVEPTSTTIHLVREAAETDEVYEAFANSGGRLYAVGEEDGRGISDLISSGRVDNAGLPVLLGLAVVAAFLHPLGFHSRQARRGL
jgi:hypothetical protein